MRMFSVIFEGLPPRKNCSFSMLTTSKASTSAAAHSFMVSSLMLSNTPVGCLISRSARSFAPCRRSRTTQRAEASMKAVEFHLIPPPDSKG